MWKQYSSLITPFVNYLHVLDPLYQTWRGRKWYTGSLAWTVKQYTLVRLGGHLRRESANTSICCEDWWPKEWHSSSCLGYRTQSELGWNRSTQTRVQLLEEKYFIYSLYFNPFNLYFLTSFTFYLNLFHFYSLLNQLLESLQRTVQANYYHHSQPYFIYLPLHIRPITPNFHLGNDCHPTYNQIIV